MKHHRPPADPEGPGASGDHTGANGDHPPAAAPDRLTRSLRELPPGQASPGFTDRVLAQVGAQGTARAAETRPRRAALPALIGAGAAALGALVLLLRPAAGPPGSVLPERSARLDGSEHSAGIGGRAGWRDTRAPGPADPGGLAAELALLRQEQRDLAAEVESLRDHGRDPGMPVIYLGRSGEVDLILDLARYRQRSTRDEGGEKR